MNFQLFLITVIIALCFVAAALTWHQASLARETESYRVEVERLRAAIVEALTDEDQQDAARVLRRAIEWEVER